MCKGPVARSTTHSRTIGNSVCKMGLARETVAGPCRFLQFHEGFDSKTEGTPLTGFKLVL